MWVAAFMTCLSPMAFDCNLGVKTDRLFLNQDVCMAFVDHSKQQLEELGAVAMGHCFRIEGEAA